MKKYIGKNYWALICYCAETKDDPIICGVYAEKEEAKAVAEEIKHCPARHAVRRCDVEITVKK